MDKGPLIGRTAKLTRHKLAPEEVTQEKLAETLAHSCAAIHLGRKTATTFLNGLEIKVCAHEKPKPSASSIVDRFEVYGDGDVKIFTGGTRGQAQLLSYLKGHAARISREAEVSKNDPVFEIGITEIRRLVKAVLDGEAPVDSLQTALVGVVDLTPHKSAIRKIGNDLVTNQTFNNPDGKTVKYPDAIARSVALRCFAIARESA